jgi:hypothetical protein
MVSATGRARDSGQLPRPPARSVSTSSFPPASDTTPQPSAEYPPRSKALFSSNNTATGPHPHESPRLVQSSVAYWRCSSGSLIRGIAGVCATGWRGSWAWRGARWWPGHARSPRSRNEPLTRTSRPCACWESGAWCPWSRRSGGCCSAWTRTFLMTWRVPGRSRPPCRAEPAAARRPDRPLQTIMNC